MKGSLQQRAVFVLRNVVTVLLMPVCSVGFTYWFTGRAELVEYNFFYVNMSLLSTTSS